MNMISSCYETLLLLLLLCEKGVDVEILITMMRCFQHW